jgi:esterase/lipase superfamily enzyme
VIVLSGMYSLRFSVGDYSDDNIFYNSPLSYLPGLEDPWYLDQYRQSQIILCSGQGARGGRPGGGDRGERRSRRQGGPLLTGSVGS